MDLSSGEESEYESGDDGDKERCGAAERRPAAILAWSCQAGATTLPGAAWLRGNRLSLSVSLLLPDALCWPSSGSFG